MRRSDREITSREEIDAIIEGSEVCRLAFAFADEPYLVPVSFGYDGAALYFHTATSGRKIDCIEANNRVCFEFERNVHLQPGGDIPCAWTFAFESVIGYGTVTELVAPEEKMQGLNEVMLHYSGKAWEYEPSVLTMTRVWRIEMDCVTGKRSEPETPAA